MPLPTITPAPPPPLRTEPATFSTKAEAFVAWLANAPDEFNAMATAMSALESGTLSLLLAAIDAAGSGANKLPYYTGSNAVDLADLTAFARTVLAAADAAAVRALIGSGDMVGAHNLSDVASPVTAGANIRPVESIIVACSDETTALTAGVGKVSFRTPYAFTVTEVYASLAAPQASGAIFTVDINEAGVSIISTKLTIDNTETDSDTAVTAAVISDASLARRALMTVDIDQVGDGTAKGLKITLVGHRT